MIIVVLMLIGLIVGSSFGVFFSSEDTGSPMTMKSIVQEINAEYQLSIDIIRESTEYDKLESSGSRAAWQEVLAVYAVTMNTDPNNPQDVVTLDGVKKAVLEKIFWEMNTINHTVETTEESVIIDTLD